MKRLAEEWVVQASETWLRRHRPQLMLGVRIVLAGLGAFALGHLLGLRQSLWAVLTAIVVMQASVGGAFKAIVDRLVGSVVGAVWGVVVCLAFPVRDLPHLAFALVLALTPLAIAAAYKPAWRVAPVTALILLLAPGSEGAAAFDMGVSRLLEVGVGSLVAAAVALTLARSQGTHNLAAGAAGALRGMAELFGRIMSASAAGARLDDLDSLHARIRAGIAAAETAAGEIERERLVTPQGALDPAPLCRTLRRLHHDMITAARAADAPLAEPVRQRLEAPLAALSAALAAFLDVTADALERRVAPPGGEVVAQALARVAAAVTQLRTEGLTRELADDDVARLFGLRFTLEQLGANLSDLTARVRELERS